MCIKMNIVTRTNFSVNFGGHIADFALKPAVSHEMPKVGSRIEIPYSLTAL